MSTPPILKRNRGSMIVTHRINNQEKNEKQQKQTEQIKVSETNRNKQTQLEENIKTPYFKDAFKYRVEIQQMSKDMGPIFACFARYCDQASDSLENSDLENMIQATHALSVSVARKFTGKTDPLVIEIRPFRTPCAQIISQIWSNKGLSAFDPEILSSQLASAFLMVDEDLDRGFFANKEISNQASLTITSAAITTSLMRTVMAYDFRQDKHELLTSISVAVIEAVHLAVPFLMNDNEKKDDEQSLKQTVANQLTDIMVSVYERKARQVINRISDLNEEEKENFARRYNPVQDIVESFKDWSNLFLNQTKNAVRNLNKSTFTKENTDISEQNSTNTIKT